MLIVVILLIDELVLKIIIFHLVVLNFDAETVEEVFGYLLELLLILHQIDQ